MARRRGTAVSWLPIRTARAIAGCRANASVAQLVGACGAPLTIAACQPRVRAMLKPRHRALERACAQREQVTLIYGDNQSAPLPLEVLPRVLYDLGERSYLEAECLLSGTIKTYRLDRVHKVRTST